MDETAEQVFEILDIQRLLAFLPHRYPMLLVDRIVEARADEYGVGIKNVSFNDPYLSDATTGEVPALPPTILTEALAQVGAIMILAKPENRQRLPFFTGIKRVRFRRLRSTPQRCSLTWASTRRSQGRRSPSYSKTANSLPQLLGSHPSPLWRWTRRASSLPPSTALQ